MDQGRFNDLGFHGPPTPAREGLCATVCGFKREWSYDVKSRVKSLVTPYVTELDQ